MKHINKNIGLIATEVATQKKEITLICDTQGITTTALARAAGVVPSTINRFMNTENPKNALSSITMAKVRNAFAHKSYSGSDRELAILSVIDTILELFIWRDQISVDHLGDLLNQDLQGFRAQHQPGAIEVIEKIRGALNPSPRTSKLQAIHRLLSPVQVV